MPPIASFNTRFFLNILATALIVFLLNYLSILSSNSDDGNIPIHAFPVRRYIRKSSQHDDGLGKRPLKLNEATGVYELDGRPILWYYSSKMELPTYVRLMIEAMQCRNPEFYVVLLRPSNVYWYLPDLRKVKAIFDRLNAQNQTEIVRAGVLSHYGGMYLEAESSLPFGKIYHLYEQLKRYDVINARRKDGKKFARGSLGPSRRGATVFQIWYERFKDELLRRKHRAQAIDHDSARRTTWIRSIDMSREIEAELESRRTKYLEYPGAWTVNQFSTSGLARAADSSWSSVTQRLRSINWTPYLVLDQTRLRSVFANAGMYRLLTSDWLFSIFTRCALLECREEFFELRKAGSKYSPAGSLNLTELIDAIGNVVSESCVEIRKAANRFDLTKFLASDVMVV